MDDRDLASLPFTLRQLDVFAQLCELGSFKAVADRFGISQASVSGQIKALEDGLGVSLFDRAPGRPTRPSHEGAEFLADLVLFRSAALRLSSHSRPNPAAREAASVPLTVFISQYIFHQTIRPKLAQFLELNPNLDLRISADHFDKNPADRLLQADHDIILLHEADGLGLAPHTRKVATIRCGVFGHKAFRQSLTTPITPDQFNDLPFVFPPKGSYFERQALRELADHAIRPTNIVRRAQYFDILSAVLETGSAVGRTLEPLLTLNQRKNVVMLYPTRARRLALYRSPSCPAPEGDAVEEFLLTTVLSDPAYLPPDFEEAPVHFG